MTDVLLFVVILLLIGVLILQIASRKRRLTLDSSSLEPAFQAIDKAHERTERGIRDEMGRNREEAAAVSRGQREELANTLKRMSDSLNAQLTTLTQSNQARLDGMREAVEKRLEAVRVTMEEKLRRLAEDNTKSLEQMRQTVDEKLQGTLEKRLGESFKVVSERLEQVYKGLGEMQTLASGVGDLKRVLTNVKTRGTWGEVQLAALLEEVLTPDQYATNVATREGSSERVEFAIRLPGRSDDRNEAVLLPIDAKFPIEDYQRLIEAQEKADPDAAEAAGRQLELRIKQCAGDIQRKYINPPVTTDFAILFLPTEGLFAEAVRRVGLTDTLQRDYRVVVAGPTTLWAILTSLQMGFRTLKVQQRSAEVWQLLAAVKTEFGKFGEVLTKVQKKLQEASTTIDGAATRTRVIERKLRDVQELPTDDARALLMLPESGTTLVEPGENEG